jgi:S1-C subfamily serine protease
MVLEPITPALAQELGMPLATQAVVVTRLSGQPLSTFNIPFAVGDVMTKINGQPTATPRAAQGALNTSRRVWEIEFYREGVPKLVKL